MRADEQLIRDFLVVRSHTDKGQDLHLPGGKAGFTFDDGGSFSRAVRRHLDQDISGQPDLTAEQRIHPLHDQRQLLMLVEESPNAEL